MVWPRPSGPRTEPMHTYDFEISISLHLRPEIPGVTKLRTVRTTWFGKISTVDFSRRVELEKNLKKKVGLQIRVYL